MEKYKPLFWIIFIGLLLMIPIHSIQGKNVFSFIIGSIFIFIAVVLIIIRFIRGY